MRRPSLVTRAISILRKLAATIVMNVDEDMYRQQQGMRRIGNFIGKRFKRVPKSSNPEE
jgi:hypothetical protein